MVRRVFFGPLAREENKGLSDLNRREVALLLPILLFVFWIGIAPGFLLKKMNPSVDRFLDRTVVFTHGMARDN